jgi:hypothetical protein
MCTNMAGLGQDVHVRNFSLHSILFDTTWFYVPASGAVTNQHCFATEEKL